MLNPSVTRHYLQSLLAHREREVFWYCFRQSAPGYSPSGDVCWYHQQRRRHPREIVREALKANAAALILAHNHPSGKAEPSHADRLITEQVVKACQLLEIRVLDHLVIGRGECVSLPSADGFKRFFAILWDL